MPRDPIGGVVRNLFQLQRLGNTVGAEAERLIRDLFDDIAAQIARVDPTAPGADAFRRRRVEKLIGAVGDLSAERFAEIQKRVSDLLVGVGREQNAWAAEQLGRTLGSAAVDVRPGRMGATLLRSIVEEQPFEGLRMKEWFGSLQQGTLQSIRRQVQLGMAQNETIDDLVRRVRGRAVGPPIREGGKIVGYQFAGGVLDTTTRQATAIVRTAVNHVANVAHFETYKQNHDVTKQFEYVATLDSRTTLQCFPGSTIVRCPGSPQQVFRSKYVGEVVIITTATGKKLEGTPNHPVLTTDGFLPLGELKPGEHVVYTMPFEGPEVGGDEHVGMPTELAELFDALNKPAVASVGLKSATAADFDGDGVGMHGEIHVLTPHGKLRYRHDTSVRQGAMDPLLGGVHPATRLDRHRLGDLLFQRGRPVHQTSQLTAVPLEDSPDPLRCSVGNSSGDLRGPETCVEQLQREPDILSVVDVALTALQRWHDAMLLQEAGDGGRGHAVAAPEFAGCGAGAVRPDHIISVQRELRDCHVYTLSSGLGLYIAGGVVVKNCAALDGKRWKYDDPERRVPPLHVSCRSVIVPIVDWEGLGIEPPEEGTRASSGGQVPSSTTYESWLRAQPRAVQDEILGPVRAQLFREGKISLQQMVKADGGTVKIADLQVVEPTPPGPAPGLKSALSSGQMTTAQLAGSSLDDVDALIHDEPIEHAALFDADGKLVLYRSTGQASQVGFTPAQLSKMPNGTLTHNHPQGSSFSDADLLFAHGNNLAELRAVSKWYEYRLQRPAGGWWTPGPGESLAQLAADWQEELDELGPKYAQKVADGELTAAGAWRERTHEALQRLAQKYGFGYSRRHWQDVHPD